MTSILDKLTSRADRQATQQHQRQAAQQRPGRPAWASDERVPQVSLSAEYVGTMKPEDVPQDSVTFADAATYKAPAPNAPMTDAQRAGLSVALQLAKQGR